MKKVLVILGAYYPNPSANGICVGRVVDELLLQGHEVFCICNSQIDVPMTEDVGALHIRRVKANAVKKFAELAKKNKSPIKKKFFEVCNQISDVFQLVRMTTSFPVASMKQAKRILAIAEKLVEENGIDTVVGVNMPSDTLYAAYLLKKKYPHLRFVPYSLDPIYGGLDNRLLSREKVNARNLAFEKKMLEACSIFIAQHEHRAHYEKEYPEFLEKMHFVGVPLLLPHEKASSPATEGKKTVLYAGALSQSTRNPAYIFEVFKHVKNAQLVMHISNGEKWVAELAKNIDNIEVYGKIPHEEVLRKMDLADAFLNIGNTQSMFCPSKIVEYISYGKPIISTYRVDRDTCSNYMTKYPLGVYIDERTEEPTKVAQQIEQLLQNTETALPFSTLSGIYADATPNYVVRLICD